MKDIEKLIWITAFSNAVQDEIRFRQKYGKSIDEISAFSCGEMADVVLEKFKELHTSEDKEYLTPFQEGWFK